MGTVKVDVVSLAAERPNDNPALHRGVSWACLGVTSAPVALPPEAPATVVDESVPSVSLADLLTALPLDVPVPVPVPDLSSGTTSPVDSPEEIPPARISGIVGLGETPRDDTDVDTDVELLAADSIEGDDDEPIVVEDLPPLDETATLEGTEVAAERAPEVAAELTPIATIAPPASDDPWMILLSTLVDVAIGAGSPHVASLLPGLLLHGTLEAVPDEAKEALAEADIFRGNQVTPVFVAQTHAWRGILLGTGDDFAACGNAMLDEWAAELLARLLGTSSRATSLKRELRSRGVAAFGLVEAA